MCVCIEREEIAAAYAEPEGNKIEFWLNTFLLKDDVAILVFMPIELNMNCM